MNTHRKNDKIKEKNSANLEYDDKFNVEDTAKYGEFISSYFKWLSPEKQKEKANKMDKITKEE